MLKSLAHRVGQQAEETLDAVAGRLRQKLHPEVSLHVIAYRGFGARTASGWQGVLRGRVLRYKAPASSGPVPNWNNLRATYARFDTDEVSNVRISASCNDVRASAVSDEEGYFDLDFTGPVLAKGIVGCPVSLTLPEFSDVLIEGDPLIDLPGTNARFGVISDIDDTLLVTHAASFRRMMRLTLLESSATRLAFDGVAGFYQALHAGRNPFFYVSSSPWNLYDFLTDFMRLNHIVTGPLLLRDFGIDKTKLVAGPHQEHKLLQIRKVLDYYPHLPFLLSGDSGQDDPEIYTTICDDYPDRIQAIYIRDVSDHWRRRSVQNMTAHLKRKGIDMLLVPDTHAARTHAEARGFIEKDAIEKNSGENSARVSSDRTFSDSTFSDRTMS